MGYVPNFSFPSSPIFISFGHIDSNVAFIDEIRLLTIIPNTVRRRLISTSSLSATSIPESPPPPVSLDPSMRHFRSFTTHTYHRSLDLQVRRYWQAYHREVREGKQHSLHIFLWLLFAIGILQFSPLLQHFLPLHLYVGFSLAGFACQGTIMIHIDFTPPSSQHNNNNISKCIFLFQHSASLSL